MGLFDLLFTKTFRNLGVKEWKTYQCARRDATVLQLDKDTYVIPNFEFGEFFDKLRPVARKFQEFINDCPYDASTEITKFYNDVHNDISEFIGCYKNNHHQT